MSQPQPELTTERFLLRPLTPDDARDVQRYAGAREIADVTLTVPHPYEDGMAEEWIAGHPAAFRRGEAATFGIVPSGEKRIVGVIGLTLTAEHRRGELGYWIGRPFWGKGYCTEAAGAVLEYGFGDLGLNRIAAYHLARNPASGRVMQKIGMTREGYLRSHVRKWDRFEDVVFYGIIRNDFNA